MCEEKEQRICRKLGSPSWEAGMPSPGQGTLTREARGEATTLHPMWTGWTEGTCEVTPGVLDQVDKSEA